jgi:hypothetical protein
MVCCDRCEGCELVETDSANFASSRADAAECRPMRVSRERGGRCLSWISSRLGDPDACAVTSVRVSFDGYGHVGALSNGWTASPSPKAPPLSGRSVAMAHEMALSDASRQFQSATMPTLRRGRVGTSLNPKKTQQQPREWSPCPHRHRSGCEKSRTALSSVNRRRAPYGTDWFIELRREPRNTWSEG